MKTCTLTRSPLLNDPSNKLRVLVANGLRALLSLVFLCAALQNAASQTISWSSSLSSLAASAGVTDSTLFQSSPAYDDSDGTVYISSAQFLYALDSNGNPAWQAQQIGQPFATGGLISSPSIATDSTVYVGGQDFQIVGITFAALYIFNKNHSPSPFIQESPISPNANSSIDFDCYSTPAIGSDGSVFVGSENRGGITAFDSTGVPLWSFGFVQNNNFWDISSSFAVQSDGTVLAMGQNSEALVALNPQVMAVPGGVPNWFGSNPGALDAPSPQWTSLFNSSPAIDGDGTIYIGGVTGFFAFNPDGSVKWSYVPPLSGAAGSQLVTTALQPITHLFQSSPVIGPDGAIYVGANDGKLYAFTNDCSGHGHVAWTFFPIDWGRHNYAPQPVLSTPAVTANGIVYITMQDPSPTNSGNSVLFAVNSATGRAIWQLNLQNAYTTSSPAVGPRGRVYIADAQNVYCITAPNPAPLASSPWPMYMHDPKHTGNASSSLY